MKTMKTMTRFIKTEFCILAAISALGFASLEADAAIVPLNGGFETNTFVAPIPAGDDVLLNGDFETSTFVAGGLGPYSPSAGSSSISNWSWSESVAPYPTAVRLLSKNIDGAVAASNGTYAVSRVPGMGMD
jgi:hypothetical protein